MDFYEENFLNVVEAKDRKCPEFNYIDDFIFRGESDATYTLKPSVIRNFSRPLKKEFFRDEIHDLIQFYERCNFHGLKIPKIDVFEKYSILRAQNVEEFINNFDYTWIIPELRHFVCLAQHYGLPTRMLDWTFDIKIATYFACKKIFEMEKSDFPDRYTIWALDKMCIAGDNYMRPLCKTTQNTSGEIVRWPLNFTIPLYYENPNINAQKGILSHWMIHSENMECFYERVLMDTSLDTLIEDYGKKYDVSHRIPHSKIDKIPPILYKFTFPYDSIQETLIFLKQNDCLAGRIFPGYIGNINEIKELDMIDNLCKPKNNSIFLEH
jgi:hypothetical protein